MVIEYRDIYRRNIGIFTEEMQELLKNSTVAIAGVGGVGGHIAVTLARMGVGHLKIAEPEKFDVQDMNRQFGAQISTLGTPKIDVITSTVRDINPDINIKKYSDGVSLENVDDFISYADVVIDAIDYNAPLAKLELYRKSRKNGLHVITSPILGLGTLVMCFSPSGMTVEEAFNYPDSDEMVKKHRIPFDRLSGVELDYVSPLFFETLGSDKPYISTSGSAATSCAGPVCVDILKVLMRKKRKENPSSFSHINEIPLLEMPLARRVDLWDIDKSDVIDFRKLG